jgi:hypothetical protein
MFGVDPRAVWLVFLLVFQFSHVNVPYSFSTICHSFYKDKWVKLEIIQRAMLFRKFGSIELKIIFEFFVSKGLTHISYLVYVENNHCASVNSYSTCPDFYVISITNFVFPTAVFPTFFPMHTTKWNLKILICHQYFSCLFKQKTEIVNAGRQTRWGL